jgi:hypothetical protein
VSDRHVGRVLEVAFFAKEKMQVMRALQDADPVGALPLTYEHVCRYARIHTLSQRTDRKSAKPWTQKRLESLSGLNHISSLIPVSAEGIELTSFSIGLESTALQPWNQQ